MQQFEYDKIPHIGEIHAVHGAYDLNAPIQKDTLTLTERQFKNNKVIFSLQKAIEQVGLKSGMTISFHHHFRNGDHVVNMVMDTIARMGIRDLTVGRQLSHRYTLAAYKPYQKRRNQAYRNQRPARRTGRGNNRAERWTFPLYSVRMAAEPRR